MRNVRILAALGLLAAAAAANAEVSSTWTLTNDYDFRGASQSAKDPAVQASIDCADESGWYVGAWASNVDFGDDVDIDYEVDLYTGFSGGDEEGLGWDVGFVYYAYPDESDVNYPEIYGKLSYGMFSGALFYSNDFVGSSENAMYVSGDVERADCGHRLLGAAHAGYSFGDFWDEATSRRRVHRLVGRRGLHGRQLRPGAQVGRHDARRRRLRVLGRRRLQHRRPRDLHDRDDVPVGRRVRMSGEA